MWNLTISPINAQVGQFFNLGKNETLVQTKSGMCLQSTGGQQTTLGGPPGHDSCLGKFHMSSKSMYLCSDTLVAHPANQMSDML